MEGEHIKILDQNEVDQQVKEKMQLGLEDRRASATHLDSVQTSPGQDSLQRKIED